MATLAETETAMVSTQDNQGMLADKGKNRFSLDALRIPFLGSPKRGTASSSKTALPQIADHGIKEAIVAQKNNSISGDSEIAPSDKLDSEAAGKSLTAQNGEMKRPPPQLLLKPKRSALAQSGSPAIASARTPSPHRVSFSPSTEQIADAREQTLAKNAVANKGKTRQPRSKALSVKWPALRKSHSTSDLTDMQRRASVDSTESTSSSSTAASAQDTATSSPSLCAPVATKRKLFRWDKHGIHQMDTNRTQDKAKAAKVKLTKHEAVTARHAKTLEQVINAGMGLHPAPPRLSSNSDPPISEPAKKMFNKLKARPIPVAETKQLKGLKSALLDADMANGIIDRLRSMPVPLDSLNQGIGRLEPGSTIGTAGDHGDERVLTANLPDSLLANPTTKDDTEIRSRPNAVHSQAAQISPPTTRTRSAAEEALRKYAGSSSAGSPAKVTARTSSLPANESAPVAAATLTPLRLAVTSAPAPKNPTFKPVFGAKPKKLVHLDCGEDAAHRRHFDHLDGQNADVQARSNDVHAAAGASAAGLLKAGTAAAIAGVGGFLNTRASASPASLAPALSTEGGGPTMIRSMSATALPTLQGGVQLMGSSPLQMLMDPVATAAQTSGAFEVLANVSGAAIHATQDMSAFHPPLDRMAIFVHWWGFEITLPSATLAYLGTAHSVSGAFLSFLQTMAVGGGVPELLPFIKYISMFMEVEYKAVLAQDEGSGVVVAATWFMPLALVPRPWDYPLDGPQTITDGPPTSLVPNLPPDTDDVTIPQSAQTPTKKKHSQKKKLVHT